MIVDKLREENYKLKFELKMTTVKFNNLSLENARLKRDINAKTTKEIIKLENEYKSNINNLNKIIDDKDKEIDALKAEIAKMYSIMNNNSSNSGIPTSKTKIGEKKYIPNSREKSNKSIGGQKGHKKHKLYAFSDEEATEIIEVTPEKCPNCNSDDFIVTENSKDKCQTDYTVKVIKKKYKFKECICNKCNNKFHVNIPNELKEENQYGNAVKSMCLCLTNEIYTPFNKTVKLIRGITNDEINLSEGYVAKLQKQGSEKLENFINELKEYFPKQYCYGWDDGVITVGSKDAVLRTYCTDKIALFIAHEKKNKEGIKEDGILSNTSSYSIVMHDHILHNYNKMYSFDNVECIIHLIRRLKKSKENTNHNWQEKLKELLSEYNKKRNNLIEKGIEEFTCDELDKLDKEFDNILKEGKEINIRDEKNYFKEEEKNFIEDIIKYKENYLKWCYDFKLPSTNNNSERNIRPVKSKLKISGQFQNINYAKYYATIRSYIETCKRFDKNIIEACNKLLEGKPYTLKELLNEKND